MSRPPPKKWTIPGIIAIILFLALTAKGLAADPISIDGDFGDWDGRQNVSDSDGDGQSNNTELLEFYWGTNENDDTLYFMIKRDEANGPVYYAIRIDANNDGDFNDSDDRIVQVFYHPDSDLSLTVKDGNDNGVGSGNIAGESKDDGGGKVELSVSFSTLGIDPNQTINMQILASQNDNFNNPDCLPGDNDCNGTITDTPVPVLGWLGLVMVVSGVIGLAWYTKGRHLWQPTSASV